MKQKGSLLIIVIVILAISGIAGAYYFGTQSKKSEKPQASPTTLSPTIAPSPTPTVEISPTETVQETTIPSGWSTYESAQYGFEISYPSNYQALDDSENLYGWPNGVVLFYKGGQAYDIAIEAWDTQTEYEARYGVNNPNLTVHTVGNKFITLMDNTQDAENAGVITTFTPTN